MGLPPRYPRASIAVRPPRQPRGSPAFPSRRCPHRVARCRAASALPLAYHRVPRPECPGSRHARGVHPAAAGHFITDPSGRAAEPRQHRAARAAMEVDREIVSLATQPPDQPEICAQAARCVGSASTITSSRCGLCARRLGFLLDDVGDVCVGIMAAEARMAGVVNTTSPIKRSRTNKMFKQPISLRSPRRSASRECRP